MALTKGPTRHSLQRLFHNCAAVGLAVTVAACGRVDEAAMLTSAQQRLERDDAAGAAIESKNLLQAKPESAAGRFVLAKALLASGQIAGAELELDRAAKFGLPEDQLRPVQAELLLGKGNPAGVVAQFKSDRLADDRAAADLHTQIARAHLQLGEREPADDEIAFALNRQPDYAPALVLKARIAAAAGDVAAAKALVDGLLQRDPQHAPAWALQGDLLASQGKDNAAAEKAYRKALEIRPRLVDAHSGLISLLLRQPDLPAAAMAAGAMGKALPNNAAAVYYRALTAFLQNDLVAAREQTQKLVNVAADRPRLLLLAGMVESRLGALVQAETLLVKAAQGLPDAVEPARELAMVYLGLAQPQRSLATIDRLLAANTNDAQTWRLAGQAHAQLGDFRRADQAFERARALRPQDSTIRLDIARSLIARGQTEPGLRELEALSSADPKAIDADLELVAQNMRQNKIAAALAAVDAVERKRPGSALADHLRGRIQQSAGDTAAARKAFERAVDKEPGYLPAVQSLASLDVASGSPDAAVKRYEAFVKRHPKSPAAFMALAELARRSEGGAQKAAEWVDKAVAVNPSDVAAWSAAISFHSQARDTVAALARTRAALAALPDAPAVLSQGAEVQLAAGDTQQAISSLNRWISLQPLSAEAHNRLAQAQLRAGNVGAARQNAMKALELHPDSPAALRSLIAVAARDGSTARTLELIRGLQARQPNGVVGWQLEAELFAAQQQWAPATAAFRKALAKGESSPLAIQLHDALLRSGAEAEAAALARQWLQPRPDDLLFVMHLAHAAVRKGDWNQAEVRFRQALKVQPEAPALLNDLAYVLASRKNPEAIPLAQRAVKAVPYRAEFVDTLSRAYSSSNQIDKAVTWQARAVELAPRSGALRLRLAELHLKAGDKKKARQELENLERQGADGAPADEVKRLMQLAQG